MAALSLRDVRKSYRDQEVVHGVSMEVADGEFMVIVGPSGCGKSTLLRMVAGLEIISAGEIRIGSRVVNDLEPKDRDIAMVFQNYALYPHMSVYENMSYGLRIRGLPTADIEERVQRAARILELGEFLRRRRRELSGGQRPLRHSPRAPRALRPGRGAADRRCGSGRAARRGHARIRPSRPAARACRRASACLIRRACRAAAAALSARRRSLFRRGNRRAP